MNSISTNIRWLLAFIVLLSLVGCHRPKYDEYEIEILEFRVFEGQVSVDLFDSKPELFLVVSSREESYETDVYRGWAVKNEDASRDLTFRLKDKHAALGLTFSIYDYDIIPLSDVIDLDGDPENNNRELIFEESVFFETPDDGRTTGEYTIINRYGLVRFIYTKI